MPADKDGTPCGASSYDYGWYHHRSGTWLITHHALYVNQLGKRLLTRWAQPYRSELVADLERACAQDGGLGEATLKIDESNNAGTKKWSADFSADTGKLLHCASEWSDGGAAVGVLLFEPPGTPVARWTGDTYCRSLRGSVAVVSRDTDGGEWEESRVVDLLADGGPRELRALGKRNCVWYRNDEVLCADAMGLTAISVSTGTAVAMLDARGSRVRVMRSTVRGHHYVEQKETDGGTTFLVVVDGGVISVVSGFSRPAVIGDWDERSAFVASTDGGNHLEVERLCFQ